MEGRWSGGRRRREKRRRRVVEWGRSGEEEEGFFFQAEDGIRDLVRSRGLGNVYKRKQQISKNKMQQ